jgi:hypothetical protein
VCGRGCNGVVLCGRRHQHCSFCLQAPSRTFSYRREEAHNVRCVLRMVCPNTELTGTSGNASDVYSGGAYFESRLDYPGCVSSWSFSVPSRICLDIPYIRARPLPFTSFSIDIKRSFHLTLYKLRY